MCYKGYMSRPLRIEYSGALYHITSRGNQRQPIFLDDEDRKIFLDLLCDVKRKFNFVCHAYCLMPNHYHLLIETPDGNLSCGMRHLNGVYTQTFNRRHRRVGHLFQGRYKAILIEKDSHLLEVARYIVLNPLRANLTESPGKWRWSSFRATAALTKPHPALTPDWVLSQFGQKRAQAGKRYTKFVHEGASLEPIWKSIKGQILLGTDAFVEQFTTYLKGYEDVTEIPRSQRYLNRPGLDTLLERITLMDKRLRDGKIVEAVERHGYSQQEIAAYLKMHYSTISKLIKEYKKTPKIKT